MRIGSGILSALEAAGQSDVRSAQDVFNALDLRDLERISGSLLDLVAEDEGILRNQASSSTGFVNITDPRYTRISTRIYAGAAAINVGATKLRVSDAVLFPASGQVYVGRGTINTEGPLTYSSKAQVGNYWELTLSTPTTRYHNINEDVVLAQGGNRSITSGTTVGTDNDGRSSPVEFSTTQDVVLLDGEVGVQNVPIVCRETGTLGNVPAFAIRNMVTSPFPQATVSNPLPLSNAVDTEQDPELRNHVRQARASRSQGTATAVLFNTQGVYSAAENRRVLSASLIQPANEAATLYIDDGNGYEELTAGVPYEVLMDIAAGGERDFTLSGPRPVAKAYVRTQLLAPFTLVAGSKLAVVVGDTYYEHTFNADEFVAIGAALAEEVVSSINSDPNIGFSARTSGGAKQVSIFARNETPDNLRVTTPIAGVDANTYLGFSIEPAYTLRLYKDDTLLYKDGLEAVVYSQAQSFWLPMTSPFTFRVKVDNTPAATYTITDSNFQAVSSYSLLAATNSLQSWADVLNSVVPGITVAAESGRLSVKSNLGRNSRARIQISDAGGGNSSVALGMFLGTEVSAGQTSDFSLARNTGQIRLVQPLAVGQSLTAGSRSTRASIRSAAFTTGTVTLASDCKIWVSADGNAARRQVAFTAADSITTSIEATNVVRYTCTSNANAFVGVQIGDWLIVWDPAFLIHGAFKVVGVASNYVVVNRTSLSEIVAGLVPSQGGFMFFTSATQPQEVCITGGTNIPLQTIADQANTQLIGARMDVYRNKYLRVRTSDLNSTSTLALLTVNVAAAPLQFSWPSFANSTVPHLANQQTGNAELSVPDMGLMGLTSVVGDVFTADGQAQALNIGNIYLATCYPSATDRNDIDQAFRKHFAIRSGSTSPSTVRFRSNPIIPVDSIVKVSSVNTVTCAVPHGFQVGDVFRICSLSPDPNFPATNDRVDGVLSPTVFTYPEAGANNTAVGTYYVTKHDGIYANASALLRNTMVSAKPFHIGPTDSLVAVMDDNTNNLLFNVQMYRRLKPTSTTYGTSPISVVDMDNNDALLSSAFGSQPSDYFQDFYAYMRARVMTHPTPGSKSILWRAAQFGPAANGFGIYYSYPTDESQGISHEFVYNAIINTSGPVRAPFSISLKMPSSARKAGTGILATTKWTSSVAPTTGGNLVTFTYSKPIIGAGNLVRTGGSLVTATTATAHGYQSGDTVYLTSADVNFPAGPKLITVTGATAFTYTEAGVNVASGSGTSVSSAPSDPTLTSGTGVVVNDVCLIRASLGQALNPTGAYRVTAVTATTFTIAVPTDTVPTAITTPVGANGIDDLIFYAINSAAGQAIHYITYVNANLSSVVTATSVDGTSLGIIDRSTSAEFMAGVVNNLPSSSVFAWTLADGLNYVEQNDLSSNPNTITLKLPATNSNNASMSYYTEEIRLVPVLAKSLLKWFSSEAVSGIGTVGSIETVSPEDYKVQIATNTLGDQGGVEIRSSSANGVVASIVSMEGSDRINVASGTTNGLVGGFYVRIANTLPTPKQVGISAPIDGSTTIQVASNGTITFSSNIWSVTTDSSVANIRVVQVGDYSIYLLDSTASLTGAEVGGYFQIVASDGSAVNKQLYRVQSFGSNANHQFVVVENPNGVDEIIAGVTSINFYTSTSIVPGDTIYIGYPVGGLEQNQGSFLVTGFGGTAASVVVAYTFGPAGPTALGTNSDAIRATEPDHALTAKIVNISPNVAAPATLSTIYTSTGASSAFWQKFTSLLGATVTALGKFDMPVARTEGPNGYNSNVGLIGEVVKILYGDPAATTSYPGVVAVGSVVNTSGPNIKRIQVSLQVRLRSGVTQSTAVARIKTAVASFINRTPHGQSVALGKIVGAAEAVEGVGSVVLLSPTYTSANDVIAVQANEKPKVLDIETDIRVSVVS